MEKESQRNLEIARSCDITPGTCRLDGEGRPSVCLIPEFRKPQTQPLAHRTKDDQHAETPARRCQRRARATNRVEGCSCVLPHQQCYQTNLKRMQNLTRYPRVFNPRNRPIPNAMLVSSPT